MNSETGKNVLPLQRIKKRSTKPKKYKKLCSVKKTEQIPFTVFY